MSDTDWQAKLLAPTDPVEVMKQKAALRALEQVTSGMKLGLGTGSTARYFVDGLGAKVAHGLQVICVPTSEATRAQAESLNIPLAELGDLQRLDLTVDGADEMDAQLRLVKGGGGALLREKIVAAASNAMIVIADDSKLVDNLGNAGDITLRGGADAFVTDGGHYIYDCDLGRVNNIEQLASALLNVPGVVEHGLFLGYATAAVLAGSDGLQEVGKL